MFTLQGKVLGVFANTVPAVNQIQRQLGPDWSTLCDYCYCWDF